MLQHHKHEVRRKIKWQVVNGIDKTELTLLKFTNAETQTQLRWEHSKEFEYNDQMYDIVKTEKCGDTTYYWCFWDNKETLLNKQIDSMLALMLGGDAQQKNQQNQLDHFYKSLFFESTSTVKFYGASNTISASPYLFSICSTTLLPTTPPPQKS